MNKSVIVKLNPIQEKPIIGIKIVDSEYAQKWAKGIIHFSNPEIWRDKTKCQGLQLDEDDGCFCSSFDDNDEAIRNFGRVFVKKINNGFHKYFENVENIAGCCFFTIKKTDFRNGKQQYGVKIIDSQELIVTKDYFKNFIDGDYSRKKVVIFFDMFDLLDRMIASLIEMGCKREEIFFGNVYYVDKSSPFAVIDRFPFEYFLKDKKFKKQSEFRIIICSKNKAFWNRFKKSGFNVDVGDISTKTFLQDYYQDDLYFSIQENKLLFSLASPVVETGDDASFDEIITTLYQVLQNMCPGPQLSQKEIKEKVDCLSSLLMRRFGVKFCDDWRLENVPYSLFLSMSEYYKGLVRTIVF